MIGCNINNQRTTTIYNGISLSTVQSLEIAFENVPKPHAAFIVSLLGNNLLGGFGKTQTARKIASVCSSENKFQHFVWIDCENDASVKKRFLELMKQVGMNPPDESVATNFKSLMHQFYSLLACRAKEKFLFIFDNVEHFDKILEFLPLNHRASNFAVLMTSQLPFTDESYGYVRNQPLDLMLEEEAIQLVEKILGAYTMDSEEDKKLLVERSGRIALVLCVMTSTIKILRRCTSDYSINNYLMEMSDLPIQYSDGSNKLGLTYKKSFQKIVRFAIEKLNGVGETIERIAVEIFDRLAYCSSDNLLTDLFDQNYFRDICPEAHNVDMKLPVNSVSDVQIIRLAIEKLSEFSLAQIDDNTVRLVQESRRLDLKGNERTMLQKLLFIVTDMGKNEKTYIIWQYVADGYADLIHEFYAKKNKLMEFPIFKIDLLEKIIRELTQSADFEPLQNNSEEIERIICLYIYHFNVGFNIDALKRIVDVFKYDVRQISRKLLATAISVRNLDAIKWLVDENLCIPEEDNLRDCFKSFQFSSLPSDLQELKELSVEMIEETREKYLYKRVLNKLKSLFRWNISNISQRLANLQITDLLSILADSDPLKIRFCQAIEMYYGKHALQLVMHSKPINVDHYRSERDIQYFEIIRVMLSALEKLEPSVELDDIKERYAENSLFECLFICGRTHCSPKPDELEMDIDFMDELNWNDLHRAAYENNITAIKSVDPTLIESKTGNGETPLIIAAEYRTCEAATALLEQHAANVNAMDDNGMTPLQYAIDNFHLSMCNILLSHGAETHWRTKSGTSRRALHKALESFADCDGSEAEEIVVVLLTLEGCDLCGTDDVGNNVLHLLVRDYYATKYKPNHRVLHLIHSANATLVNMQNNDGVTPLELAKKLQAKFSDGHWHVASLQSFISEVEKLCINEK